MGSAVSVWTKNTKPDPATGLSERDRYLITMSWEHVTDPRMLKANAVEFYIQLFDKYPHMQDYFTQFKGMNKEQLRNSTKLRVHAMGALYQISSYVHNTGDPETLVALVEKVCKAHADRGIKTQDFVDLAEMFVPYLRSLLGKEVTPETEEAWSKLLAAQTAIFKATEAKLKGNA